VPGGSKATRIGLVLDHDLDLDQIDAPSHSQNVTNHLESSPLNPHKKERMTVDNSMSDKDNLSSVSTILGLALFCLLIATILIRRVMVHRVGRRYSL
jgi:hypothetical protein